ncbi:hypothetical protein [Thermococcus peptonophilus]|uniref:Uncharacterized protein n=1 Tax=Thermococcus peptonophilus TaxID=53952 RepID=A0A142CXT2_9EURY|nr:hypothetical protein [Thermococcus peptonophilus]AMQ19584.1 hypothetical protein A0127_10110 [Thermococcus peptonophilus]
MEWKSLFIGLIIGALIAVPLGMAHSGGFDIAEKTGTRWGFGPMGGYMHGGMMGYGMHGMMDDEMYEQMEDYMASGNFTEIHEEMEPYMNQYMGNNWAEMHEACEKAMGIEDEGDE